MGSYTIESVIDSAETILEDEGNERWSTSQFLGFYNRAIEAICRVKPDAYTVRENVTLEAGTVQRLPERRHKLIRPIRNMGSSGNRPGNAIRFVSFDMQNDYSLDWHAEKNAQSVDDVMYEEDHPLEFWVSPPALGQKIELLMAAIPDQVTEIGTNTVSILDIYRTPLIYLIVGYAHQSNRNDVQVDEGNKFIGMAMLDLGVQTQGESKKK